MTQYDDLDLWPSSRLNLLPCGRPQCSELVCSNTVSVERDSIRKTSLYSNNKICLKADTDHIKQSNKTIETKGIKHAQMSEQWEEILKKQGICYRSILSRTAAAKWKRLMQPESRARLTNINEHPLNAVTVPASRVHKTDTMSGVVGGKLQVANDTSDLPVKPLYHAREDREKLERPANKTMDLRLVKCENPFLHIDDKNCPVKDPFSVGWTKIFARRIQQRAEINRTVVESPTGAWWDRMLDSERWLSFSY